MKKYKNLAPFLQEFNGVIARMKKNPSDENLKLLDETFIRLREKMNEVNI